MLPLAYKDFDAILFRTALSRTALVSASVVVWMAGVSAGAGDQASLWHSGNDAPCLGTIRRIHSPWRKKLTAK